MHKHNYNYKVGDVVTIIVDYPYNVPYAHTKGEVGVIVSFDDLYSPVYQISTGNPETEGYWFSDDEFRDSTFEECRDRLVYILGKGKMDDETASIP